MDDTSDLVSIFKTDDPAVLPLATMALDAEGIAYAIRSAGKADSLQWMMSSSTKQPTVREIMVASDVAVRARDLVVDLERPMPALSPADPGAVVEGADPPSIQLEDAATGIAFGTITEGQLQELTSHLEEDESAPQQYFVDAETIDRLLSAHADAELVSLLRHAVGVGDGLVVRWTVR